MSKISFVVPVWDGDAFLSETIESIRNQSLKDIEIIVIDDCSPDFTSDLMEWYVKQDERIRYHRFEENKGVQEARNFGNQQAQAELICVSDQDDLSAPKRAEFSYHYMKRFPEINCITSAYHECNSDGFPIRKWQPETITKETLLDGSYLVSGGWLHSSACYRKEDIFKIPYRQMDGETDDWRFLIDWLDAGMKFKSVKAILANKRLGPDREMNRRRLSQGQEPNFVL